MNMSPDKNPEMSLLPYLKRGNKCAGLSLVFRTPTLSDQTGPFCILDDSDPLARLIEASFVTDAGSEVRKALLLVSKDRYGLKGDQLWPLANPDIDIAWQKAYSHYAGQDDDGYRIVLSGQTDESGRFSLISSLFHCGTRNLFFHPPCPACGAPLQLCRDDELLSLSGLQPYSGSLKRYLYCASCSERGVPEFYAREREHDDPVMVHDQHSLVDGFGTLRESGDGVGAFPCIGCPEHDVCYGSGREVHSRIAPFSFYPFYMLIFGAMTLHSVDFLSLVSGAPFDELKSRLSARNELGRLNCVTDMEQAGLTGTSMFPAVDERSFLEVLYLKLSFLGDIVRQFIPAPVNSGHPAIMPAIDGIWVDISPPSDLLPSFWNFRTKAMDIIKPPGIAQLFPQSVTSSLVFQLGLLWFHALLVNGKQNSREVFHAICGSMPTAKGPSNVDLSGATLLKIFPPEQIFWNPAGRSVNKGWFHLWERSLDLGVGLIRSAIDGNLEWPLLNLPVELEQMRTEAKNAMFAALPVKSEVTDRLDGAASDKTIHDILSGILDKWRRQAETEAEIESGIDLYDRMDTVIIPPPKKTEPPPPPIVEDELTETVIISSGTAVKPANDSYGDLSNVRLDNDVPETVIISPGASQAAPTGSDGCAKAAGTGPPAEAGEKASGDDILAETVVITTGSKKVKWKVREH